MDKLFFSLFISIFYLVGFGMLGFGIYSAKQSIQASKWPSTTGTIIDLSLNEDTDSDGDATYRVKVKYRYSVMGQPYISSRLAFGYMASSGRQSHQEILNKLQSASAVSVRYNPKKPAISVLSFGLHRSIRLFLTFAITWLIFVIGFTLIWLTMSQSDQVLLDNLKVLSE